MANSFYNAFLNGILGAHAIRVDLDADTIKMALVDAGTGDGAPDAANDDFWDDQDSGLVGTPYALVNKDIGGAGAGVFDNTVNPAPAFTAVSGAACEHLVFFKDTGTPSNSNLLWWFDISLTPNGGDVNVTFHASGIAKI